MSSIGPDTRLNVSGLDRLDRQIALDDLRRQTDAADEGLLQGLSGDGDAAIAGRGRDAGEDVLTASAWDGFGEGSRLLSGDLVLESQLGAMDLADAADHAATAVFDAI